MTEYHKIPTVWHRDPATKHKTLIEGMWATDAFGYLAMNDWHYTEKVDGTNIRVMVFPHAKTDAELVSYGGKTNAAQLPATLVTALDRLFRTSEQLANIREVLSTPEVYPTGTILYGEGYGARIQQSGGNYRPDQSFVLFDVRVGPWWLSRDNVCDIAEKLKLDVVPLIGTGSLFKMVRLAREGFKSRWGDFRAEGIVARPAVEMCDRAGRRIITKVKHKDFPNG